MMAAVGRVSRCVDRVLIKLGHELKQQAKAAEGEGQSSLLVGQI